MLPCRCQLPCRLFGCLEDFRAEAAQYENAVLRQALPQVLMASENADGHHCSPSGFVLPAFLITVRFWLFLLPLCLRWQAATARAP